MYQIIKRVIDVLMAFVTVMLLSPFLLFIAIAIKLDSQGPVFFIQDRLGLQGKVFKMYKFRSMSVGAEHGGVYTTKDDTRVTRVGRIIRATSIDEIPQLLNILKGEMSFIGPRPTLKYHPWPLDKYSTDQRKRFLVRPGVTGWAQVNGRKEIHWNQRLILDVEYVNNISFSLDLKIFFITIIKVLTMKENANLAETVIKS